MLWEPHVEGANAHATLSHMYFNSFVNSMPFIDSTPMFAALYHAFKGVGMRKTKQDILAGDRGNFCGS